MKHIKIQKSSYPTKQISYNQWCKKFKVGSRIDKSKLTSFYADGEYDHNKFIKMINNYGQNKQRQNILQQISEALLTLCKGQVQKARNKISIA
jgi:hypothetical protein